MKPKFNSFNVGVHGFFFLERLNQGQYLLLLSSLLILLLLLSSYLLLLS